MFRELADVGYFRKASVQHGTVVWPHEQDICPDTLYLDSARGRPVGKASRKKPEQALSTLAGRPSNSPSHPVTKGDHKPPLLIATVAAQPHKRLLVRFRNGVTKMYDCKKLLKLPVFKPLRRDDTLFQRAHADKHGYGVVWNDELDLAECEVWTGGKVVQERRTAYRSGPVKKATRKSVTA